jgi:hypothetical protein
MHFPEAPGIPHDAALVDADAFKLPAARGKKSWSKYFFGCCDVNVYRPLLAAEPSPLCGK